MTAIDSRTQQLSNDGKIISSLAPIIESITTDVVPQVSQTQTSVQGVSSRIDQMMTKLSEIQLTRAEDYEITAEGHSLENAIGPLRFMNAKIGHAMEVVARRGTQTISTSQHDWFISEMLKLNRYAYRSAGTCTLPPGEFRGPHSTCFDLKRHISTLPLRPSRASFANPDGLFVIEYVEGSDSCGRKVQRYRFACFTFERLLSLRSVVAGMMENRRMPGSAPQVSRHLRIITVVPKWSEPFTCVYMNDLVGLQRLFSTRKAGPFLYNEQGFSLLGVSRPKSVPEYN